MPNYRRVRVAGGTYFFTVNLLERRRTLLVDHIDVLRESFHIAHAAKPYALLAWVILPDHLHCVWRLPDGDDDNGTRWRHIKSRFSRCIPVGERLSDRRREKGERGIWQRRYWEGSTPLTRTLQISLIMGQEECHATKKKVQRRVQA